MGECSRTSPDPVGPDAEDVAVRVAEVELTNTPRLVYGRHRYLEAQVDAEAVHRIHRIRRSEKPRHPHPTCRLVEGKGGRGAAARPDGARESLARGTVLISHSLPAMNSRKLLSVKNVEQPDGA